MPINVSAPIIVFDQEAFHAVDKVVTGLAFKVHNEYGRYLDEQLYQVELAARFAAHGFEVMRELKITLTLGDFIKDYYADFLVEGGVLVETKTVEVLTRTHKAQVLNYLYLCGLRHATLLNLRPERVQHQFVSTSLTHESRRSITLDIARWRPLTPACEIFKNTIVLALEDWGACLDLIAYRDAVIFFLGGEAAVTREVEIRSEHGTLGRQSLHFLASDVAFSITASVHDLTSILEHQRRFLRHTNLRAIQWINLNRQVATFHTITPT